MQRDLDKLKSQTFDVVVIGGGITGACLAHQLSSGGMSVALVEKNDFGGFTSSASSKLLHGGIRYLQQAKFGKVRESARERAYFHRVAPHLSRNVPFLILTHKGSLVRGRLALQLASGFYEWLTGPENRRIEDPTKRVPRGSSLTRSELLAHVPELASQSGLTGARVLYESQMHSSERMTLAFLKTADAQGACIANYLPVDRLMERDGRIVGVQVTDSCGGETFEIRSRLVANAAGPLIPSLNKEVGLLSLKRETTGFSKGVHLVTRRILDDHALAIATRKRADAIVGRGGRHIFIIPWRGRSLIGTTDVPFDGDTNRVRATERDITDFLDDINSAIPEASLTRKDVHYAFAGLYPLSVKEVKTDTYQGHGEYQVVDHGRQDGVEGVVTVFGAKFTTAPQVAEVATRLLTEKLATESRGLTTPSHGDRLNSPQPLLHADIRYLEDYIEEKKREFDGLLEPEVVVNLVHHYGTEIDTLVDRIHARPDLGRRLAPDRLTLEVEALFAATDEAAMTLQDVIFRRTGLGTIGHPGDSCLQRCSGLIAPVLGWSESKIRSEIEQVDAMYTYED